MDDIHPTPSIVDNSTSCDQRQLVPGQRIYANPAVIFFSPYSPSIDDD